MFQRRRVEREAPGTPQWWAEARYWLCWLLLLALVGYLV
jgi:hypothetical protein